MTYIHDILHMCETIKNGILDQVIVKMEFSIKSIYSLVQDLVAYNASENCLLRYSYIEKPSSKR